MSGVLITWLVIVSVIAVWMAAMVGLNGGYQSARDRREEAEALAFFRKIEAAL